MTQEVFKAGVQYGDMKGTAAADEHDQQKLRDFLVAKGLWKDGDFLIGVEMYSGEVHTQTQENPISVTLLLATGEGYENIQAAIDSGNPLHVRRIKIEMKLSEFFGFFKRFNITVSRHGLIDGKEIQFTD